MFSLKSKPHFCGGAAIGKASVLLVIVMMTAALWFTSCDPEIEGIVTQNVPVPRLLTLDLSDTGISLFPDFDPNQFAYSVTVEGEIAPLYITATTHATFKVEMPFEQPFLPANGSLAVVTVSDSFGRRENYYIQFTRKEQELPIAKLSGIMLSVGSIDSFSPAANEYNVSIPYGSESVTVFPEGGQPGSFFTYNPAATVTLDPVAGTGTVTIGVIAANHALNEYILHFEREEDGESSTLAGISLSSGVLAQAFEPEAESEQTIIVPDGTTELTVLAVKENWTDTVHFDSDEPSDGKLFTGPFDDTTFSITVNGGLQYTDKTYQFRIQTAAEGPALLSGLFFSGDGVETTVYQRNTDSGENAAQGFAAAVNVYNLNFTHGAVSAEITAAAMAGATITVSGVDAPPPPNNSVSIPVDALSSSRLPVKLTVRAAGWAANEYTVYFKKSDPPFASLSGLTITGIIGQQPDISGAPAAEHTFSAFDVYSHTGFLVVNATAPSNNYLVRCENSAGGTQNYLLAPNISSSSWINVYISCGGDYQESVYRINFNELAPLVPRLSSLQVNGDQLIEDVSTTTLTHEVSIGYNDDPAPVEVPFMWTIDSGSVSQVQYMLNNETGWTTVGGGNYSGTLFSINPAESITTLMRVSTYDGLESVYNITVTRAGDTANQLSALSVTPAGGSSLMTGSNEFDAAQYAYMLNVENDVAQVDIGVSTPLLATLYTSINGAPYAIEQASGG